MSTLGMLLLAALALVFWDRDKAALSAAPPEIASPEIQPSQALNRASTPTTSDLAKAVAPLTHPDPAKTTALPVRKSTELGLLEGTIWIDPTENLIFHSLRVALIGSTRRDHTPAKYPFKSRDGIIQFQVEGDPEKTYSLEIRTHAMETVFLLENITFNPGQTISPPGLQPLDLRSKFRQIKLKVVNPNGKAIPGDFEMKSGHINGFTSSGNGEATYSILNSIPKIEVRSRGYIRTTLHDVAVDQIIALEPAVKVIAVVPVELLHYRDTDLELYVYTWNSSGSLARVKNSFPKFDESGRAEFYVPRFGNYHIKTGIRVHVGSRGHAAILSGSDLKISRYDQEVEWEIDTEIRDQKIDELLEKVKKQKEKQK